MLNDTAKVAYTQYAYGKFIEAINDVSNNENGNGHYWQYWVNDQLAPTAADNYILSDSDHILWKYCSPEEPATPTPPTAPQGLIGFAIIGVVGSIIIITAVLIGRKSK